LHGCLLIPLEVLADCINI